MKAIYNRLNLHLSQKSDSLDTFLNKVCSSITAFFHFLTKISSAIFFYPVKFSCHNLLISCNITECSPQSKRFGNAQYRIKVQKFNIAKYWKPKLYFSFLCNLETDTCIFQQSFWNLSNFFNFRNCSKSIFSLV